MTMPLSTIHKVRASRDGHEFHEAWAARVALGLLMPSNNLVGVAMEGLAPEDEKTASPETVQIADVTLYYGKHPTFRASSAVDILQLKYSIGRARKPFRATDAKKTIQKFAAAFRDHKREYGAKEVQKKLNFELITNRPISDAFVDGVKSLRLRKGLKGDAKTQADQFKSASGLTGSELTEFAQKFELTGLVGSLNQNNQRLSRVIADWSATHDAIARARLGEIRQLMRKKAGSEGERENVITRVDILKCLGLSGIEDLLPCESVFPDVGQVVPRAQLGSTISLVPRLEKPLLIHAAGGVGKTVFMQSLSMALSIEHEVVLFDCFGGGAYRAPDDARHLPSRGLIHITNILACKGFCDPLLPPNESVTELMRAFRHRLSQVVATLQRGTPGKLLLLFIDAIDNAAEQAKDKGQPSFATLVLESFQHSGPIPGVKLIVSCRSHRRDISRDGVPCEELELQPFNAIETEGYLRNRIPGVTNSQVQVAFSRSGGNPRILEHLALSDRGLLDASEVSVPIKLDKLLEDRIERALGEAQRRGYSKSAIEAFLAGLVVLPPPVPIAEYANAHDMEVAAVESFAADLAPLLERTKHGLMFRDEPTETFVKEHYAAKKATLKKLAENLFKKQGESVYAASALPGLLTKLGDSGKLFTLAFDDRFPQAISTKVGQQHIRHNRLTAAVLSASQENDAGRLVRLLVELSSLAAVNQRGTEYVMDNPDLVIASGDVDATRRLFETRTVWPGTRHSRLSIAVALTGDIGEATRHAIAADEWIRHFNQQEDETRRRGPGPKRIDMASIALCLAAQNRPKAAVKFIGRFFDWAGFEIGEHLFRLLDQATTMGSIPSICLNGLLNELDSELGVLASAISFLELEDRKQRRLIKKLSRACAKSKSIKAAKGVYQGGNENHLHDGLLKPAAMAVALRMHQEARAIATAVPSIRPDVWAFADHFSNSSVASFLIHAAVLAASNGKSITEQMVLPGALARIASRVPPMVEGAAYRTAIKAELGKEVAMQQQLPKEKRVCAYEKKAELEEFVDTLLEPLLEITRSLLEVLSSRSGEADNAFLKVIENWTTQRTRQEGYRSRQIKSLFDVLGRQFLSFLVRSRKDLALSSVEAFIEHLLQNARTPTSSVVDLIAILAKRPAFHQLAGKTAVKAKGLVEQEDDVNSRASLLADLSRAIRPASNEEAASYFRAGLEQMDAIGSGDYEFTNELLFFAASIKGAELSDSDVHTLTNICELNMYDQDKFPWAVFGQALNRTAGCRGFAKLARWNDRGKASFDYSLLPYLKALVEDDKIDPTLALAILLLSDAIELNGCGIGQLAKAVEQKQPSNSRALIAALIAHFERNHLEARMSRTRLDLSEVARRVLGADAPEAADLSARAEHYDKVSGEDIHRQNYRTGAADDLLKRRTRPRKNLSQALNSICGRTRPTDEASISQSLADIDKIDHSYDAKREFFENIRGRVKFAEQSRYIDLVARLAALDVYPKLAELKKCKEVWGGGSMALRKVFHDLALPLIEIHAKDLVSHDYFSGHMLREISEVSGVDMPNLAVSVAAVFAGKRPNLPAPAWLGLAATICRETSKGEGQAALRRLLNSGAAKLSSKVVDGPWIRKLYSEESPTDIAAGLIWQSLGSPWAITRWRAAHSVRFLAQLNRWDVIDALLEKSNSKHVFPYQAGELPFYYFHAQLWLLIALARLAIDHPKRVFGYRSILKRIAIGPGSYHVLLRHFASQALLQCIKDTKNHLSNVEIRRAVGVNESPLQPVKAPASWDNLLYKERPASLPEPASEFHLEYEFDKYQVPRIANAFGRSVWEVRDAITNWVRTFDQKTKGMYDHGGRETGYWDRFASMNSEHHGHGEYLGWHGLYEVAGKFLANYPVAIPADNDDPWKSWFTQEVLTRTDGLWLSDGIDPPPLSVQVNLLETGNNEIRLTSSKEKLMALVGLGAAIPKYVVACGDWWSADGILVRVSSALVAPRAASKMARQLAKEEPFGVHLPFFEEDEEPAASPTINQGKASKWIIRPSAITNLDNTDPWSASSAVERPRFTMDIESLCSLKAADAFNREWIDGNGLRIAKAEAWGCHKLHEDKNPINGQRLSCDTAFLKRILTAKRSELLLLVVLRRYDEGHRGEGGKYWHTTAVIRINRSLDFAFYAGASSQFRQMKY